MSLFADYKQERDGKTVIENEKSFAVYSIVGSDCYIEDIYVRPESRRDGVATELANYICQVAKQKNCKRLFASVSPSNKVSHENMLFVLSFGMKLHAGLKDMIFFVKEL